MSINEPEEKQPWFSPKRNACGVTPRTWQGWLCLAAGVAIYIAMGIGVRRLLPAWFVPKVNGVGWNPATWQGYAVIFAPPVIVLLALRHVYLKQRKR